MIPQFTKNENAVEISTLQESPLGMGTILHLGENKGLLGVFWQIINKKSPITITMLRNPTQLKISLGFVHLPQ